MNTLLSDKVTLVTGNSSGIGRAAAVALARAGGSVGVRREGDDARCTTADVRDSAPVQRARVHVIERDDRLDSAFGNAGIIVNLASVAGLYGNKLVGALPEVNDTAVWLLFDAASLITGHALPIDGRLLAQ